MGKSPEETENTVGSGREPEQLCEVPDQAGAESAADPPDTAEDGVDSSAPEDAGGPLVEEKAGEADSSTGTSWRIDAPNAVAASDAEAAEAAEEAAEEGDDEPSSTAGPPAGGQDEGPETLTSWVSQISAEEPAEIPDGQENPAESDDSDKGGDSGAPATDSADSTDSASSGDGPAETEERARTPEAAEGGGPAEQPSTEQLADDPRVGYGASAGVAAAARQAKAERRSAAAFDSRSQTETEEAADAESAADAADVADDNGGSGGSGSADAASDAGDLRESPERPEGAERPEDAESPEGAAGAEEAASEEAAEEVTSAAAVDGSGGATDDAAESSVAEAAAPEEAAEEPAEGAAEGPAQAAVEDAAEGAESAPEDGATREAGAASDRTSAASAPADSEGAKEKATEGKPTDGASPSAQAAASASLSESTEATGAEQAADAALPPMPTQPPPAPPGAGTGPTPEPGDGSVLSPEQNPLGLLAQLTNTPPKPETPLRLAVRRAKVWVSLLVLVLIVATIVQEVRPVSSPELQLTAEESYTFPGQLKGMPWPEEGQAALSVKGLGQMGTHGPQKQVPIGSVTKVLTAYIILRDHPLKLGHQGPKIRVDAKAVADAKKSASGESVVNVVKGQKLSERQALEAMLIPSANNVARLVARWDAGSEQAFEKKMNATAKKLGMRKSRFTDPSGLRASTVSTAPDLVKLGIKAMEDPVFRTIVNLPEVHLPHNPRQHNWNTLVGQNGVTGIKTGSTTKAGGSLLFSAKKKVAGKDQLIIGAVLGQHGVPILQSALDASKKLIVQAQQKLTSETVLKKGQVVGQVDDGTGNKTPVVAGRDVQAAGWSGLTVPVQLGSGKKLARKMKADTTVGKVVVGGRKSPVTLREPLQEPGFVDKLFRF